MAEPTTQIITAILSIVAWQSPATVLESLIASDPAFIVLTVGTVVATGIVGVGLGLEYERHELRMFRRSKTRRLTIRDFQTKKFNRPHRKQIGSFLVVVGVIFEAIFGVGTAMSAILREEQNAKEIVSLDAQMDRERDERTRDLAKFIMELTKESQPRTIGADQGGVGGSALWALRRVSAPKAVLIQHATDEEAARAAGELAWLLDKDGYRKLDWHPRFVTMADTCLRLTGEGVTIYVRANSPVLDAARGLNAHLQAIKVASNVVVFGEGEYFHIPNFDLPADDMLVYVGTKPVPNFNGLIPVWLRQQLGEEGSATRYTRDWIQASVLPEPHPEVDSCQSTLKKFSTSIATPAKPTN